MISLSSATLATAGLLMGSLMALALWLAWRGRAASAAAGARRRENDRLRALLCASPALPLLVDRGGRLTTDGPVAALFGLEAMPERLVDMVEAGALSADDAALLEERVRATARTAASSTLILRPARGSTILRIELRPAPPALGRGTALLWLLDVTAHEEQAAAAAGWTRSPSLSRRRPSRSGIGGQTSSWRWSTAPM